MQFQIPVVLFFFRRISGIKKIIEVLKQIKPAKLYIFSDGGRNKQEKDEIDLYRKQLKELIDWNCDLILRFKLENEGVYKQIALGAKEVFEHEENAIFLEDDNLPEVSFFDYCQKMLAKYKDEEKVLWICGTNYLGSYSGKYDYYFTKSLLPCGWASWSNKFLKYYDFDLSATNSKNFKKEFFKKYQNRSLAKQQYDSVMYEKNYFEKNGKYHSWDYHMMMSIRMNNLFGVIPANNQIKNIGVDNLSIHQKNEKSSLNDIMTKRFCGMDSYPLESFVGPSEIKCDKKLEKKLEKIILLPFRLRLRTRLAKIYHFFKK